MDLHLNFSYMCFLKNITAKDNDSPPYMSLWLFLTFNTSQPYRNLWVSIQNHFFSPKNNPILENGNVEGAGGKWGVKGIEVRLVWIDLFYGFSCGIMQIFYLMIKIIILEEPKRHHHAYHRHTKF